MFNIKSYFNIGLYKEGLRKTRTLALLLIAIMVLVAILAPVSEISNYLESVRRGWHVRAIDIYGLQGALMSPFMLFVGAPFITLSIFSFLNKRCSSDLICLQQTAFAAPRFEKFSRRN